jgi:predicted phosphodiesterase
MNSPDCRLDQSSFIVLSDIHADPGSMEAVLKAAYDESKVTYRCFLGDAIGYGDDPVTVLDRLADFDVLIKGNHEMLALEESDPNWYSRIARVSILDHVHRLSAAHRTLISKFADKFVSGNIILFHGHPESALEYIFGSADAKDVFESFPQYDLFFGGHLHIPRLAVWGKESEKMEYYDIEMPYSSFSLDLDRYRYLITCPSVTPGRFRPALPGCCRLQHQTAAKKTLEFIFVEP